jgi:ketosteroid isomerase-like protein
MRRSLAIAALSFIALSGAAAQQQDSAHIAERVVTRADARQPTTDAERRIWRLMTQEGGVRAPLTDDAVLVSGAFPKPVFVGARARTAAARDSATASADSAVSQRRNESTHVYPIRVEVSRSGDLAYGLALFAMSFERPDSAGKTMHVSFEGTQMSIYRKVGGQWHLAAMFARPNE